MSRCVLWRRSSRKWRPARPSEPGPESCVQLEKGSVLMKAAGRFASRKPVSKGPSRPGAVIINSLVTVVPPCGRPVTITTGGPARSDVSDDVSSALAAAAIRRTAHAKRRDICHNQMRATRLASSHEDSSHSTLQMAGVSRQCDSLSLWRPAVRRNDNRSSIATSACIVSTGAAYAIKLQNLKNPCKPDLRSALNRQCSHARCG